MKAYFNSTCRRCGTPYVRGDDILGHMGGYVHRGCKSAALEALRLSNNQVTVMSRPGHNFHTPARTIGTTTRKPVPWMGEHTY